MTYVTRYYLLSSLPTAIPYYSVNLMTGKTVGNNGKGNGNIVNLAQGDYYFAVKNLKSS